MPEDYPPDPIFDQTQKEPNQLFMFELTIVDTIPTHFPSISLSYIPHTSDLENFPKFSINQPSFPLVNYVTEIEEPIVPHANIAKPAFPSIQFPEFHSPLNDIDFTKATQVSQKTIPNPKEDHQPLIVPVLPSKHPDQLPEKVSKLFPRSTVHDAKVDAVIADSSLQNFPYFLSAFQNCRIAFRKLRCADIELSPTAAILFQDIRPETVVHALAVYQTVYLFTLNRPTDIPCSPRLIARVFPDLQTLLAVARTKVQPHSFVREKETLHESLLSLFPTVSRMQALAWLQIGNPIKNTSVASADSVGSQPFLVLLDAASDEYRSNRCRPGALKAKAPREPDISSYFHKK